MAGDARQQTPTKLASVPLTALPRRRKFEDIAGNMGETTLLQDADAWIYENHYTSERLKIDRLSGESLPMEQCYINLALVEKPGQAEGFAYYYDKEVSAFSLFARQRLEIPDKENQVDLASLFSQREGVEGRSVRPRRILIQGRAGMGKTTLCKKIVHEFTQGTWSDWSELFDRILWVPLRHLRLAERRRDGYDFTRLFTDEYFTVPEARPDLAKELFNALNKDPHRTLFLLDGLDEVSQGLTGSDPMSGFLDELLSQPSVIITSRWSARRPLNLDLVLEATGFYPDQVTDHLFKTLEPSKAQEMQSFLDKDRLIQGLFRIPVLLDALCYTWDDFRGEPAPQTMTAVYQSLEKQLWKKDVVNLGKKSEAYISGASSEVQRLVEPEMMLLEHLAFTGLYNNVVDFTQEHRDLFTVQSDLTLNETLARLPFLRTCDLSLREEDQTFHFIHLTYQEYFAARYFVRKWISNQPLICLSIKGQESKQLLPVMLLQQEKYSARYDIFWRFVAGLLDAKDVDSVLQFFQEMDQEPLDLLGPAHQRLTMHCLSEVTGPLPIREDLHERLAKWLLFEYRLNHSQRLLDEAEFPDRSIEMALTLPLYDEERMEYTVLGLLRLRTTLPPHIVAFVAERLESYHFNTQWAAQGILGNQSALPEDLLASLTARLNDKTYRHWIRPIIARVLGKQSSLPETILADLAARLRDKLDIPEVRTAVAETICSRPDLPKDILAGMATQLQDREDDDDVRRSLCIALARRSVLPEAILASLAAVLRDKSDDADVRLEALCTLAWRIPLPEEITACLEEQLHDTENDDMIRAVSARGLGRRSFLSETTLAGLTKLLKDDQNVPEGIRKAVSDALGTYSALPGSILADLASLVRDKTKTAEVRGAAALVLGSQKSYPEVLLEQLRVEGGSGGVSHTLAKALRSYGPLPETVVRDLGAHFSHPELDFQVRDAIMETLSQQPDLPEDILDSSFAQFTNKDYTMLHRACAGRLLRSLTSLPQHMLGDLEALLDDDDKSVRLIASEILCWQLDLPAETLARLHEKQAEDENYDEEEEGKEEEDDEDHKVSEQMRSLKSLQFHSGTLPASVITGIVARGGLNKRSYERAVGSALRHQPGVYRSLLRGPYATALCRFALREGFAGWQSWYIHDDHFHIRMMDETSTFSTPVRNMNMKRILGALQPSDKPTVSGRG